MNKKRQAVPAQQQRALNTRSAIEEAALSAFSDYGFDGATTREIAKKAGVKQQLLIYHYRTKLDLWKVVVDDLIGRFARRFNQRLEGLSGVDESTQLRLLIKEYLLFASENPELIRVIIHEGGKKTPRLVWITERHSKAMYDFMANLFRKGQEVGSVRSADPYHLIYIMLGSAVLYSQRAEYEIVTGAPLSDEVADSDYLELVVDMIMPSAS